MQSKSKPKSAGTLMPPAQFEKAIKKELKMAWKSIRGTGADASATQLKKANRRAGSGPRLCPKCGSDRLRSHHQGDYAYPNKDRWECKDCGHKTRHPRTTPPGEGVKIPTKITVKNNKTYLVTCAQNATKVFAPGWKNLLAYAKHINAEVLVIPTRYQNPTSQFSKLLEHEEWWASELSPYLFAGRQILNDGIVIMGDLKTQMTASNPLNGYETISGARSAVIGHPKLALRTVATPQTRLPKIITTTGAITQKNYTDTRAGKTGEFHHTYGAALIEVGEGEEFHLRQINMCDDGSFIDLNVEVRDGKARKAPRAAALVLGDWHQKFTDPAVAAATFNDLVPMLKPERIVWHDVLDFFAGDHHHDGNPFIDQAKVTAGLDDVRKEVIDAARFIIDNTPRDTESAIVASNHDEHLSRWIREKDWRSLSAKNRDFYLETALAMLRGTVMKKSATSTPDPFHYWFKKEYGGKGRFRLLGRDESYSVLGVDMGHHGDKGANGARGNLKVYARIGTKTITGHSHTAGIEEGAYAVGTSSFLKLDYNAGLSGWVQCHCALYANGKRSLIFIKDGQFCT
jgi:hypothetical protein